MNYKKEINKLYKKHNEGFIAVCHNANTDKINFIHLDYIGQNTIHDHIAKDSKDIFNNPIKITSDNFILFYVGLIDNLENNKVISKNEYENFLNSIEGVCSNGQTNILKLSTREDN